MASGSSPIAMTSSALANAIQRATACGPKNNSEITDGRSRFGTAGDCSPPVSPTITVTMVCADRLMPMNTRSNDSASYDERSQVIWTVAKLTNTQNAVTARQAG